MRRVAVVGVGSTPYGKLPPSARELLADAVAEALDDAGVAPKQVEGAFYGNAFSVTEKQGHLGPLVNTALGMADAPSTTIETACASGGSAFREAFINVAGGFADVMVAGGVEKVSQLDTLTATSYFAMGSDFVFEGGNGCSFPGLYATMATAYFARHGATEEDLAHIAVKNHKNGASNPLAHFQKEITVEQALKSMTVASPLKLYDCCPFSDGAAAVILASEDVARKFTDTPVWVLGSGKAGAVAGLHDRPDLTSIPSTRLAAAKALKMAGKSVADMDFVELHDCFTIAEAIASEDLGLFPRGKGAVQARQGVTYPDGKRPVNPSGGLKAKGHPVGATGVGQIVEVVKQFRGQAGKRTVAGAEVALTHNVGATGGTCVVHVLGRSAS